MTLFSDEEFYQYLQDTPIHSEVELGSLLDKMVHQPSDITERDVSAPITPSFSNFYYLQ